MYKSRKRDVVLCKEEVEVEEEMWRKWRVKGLVKPYKSERASEKSSSGSEAYCVVV